MKDHFRLRQTSTGWEFQSEGELEDFLWANLRSLLSFNPLKRQHYVSEQVCDILAVGDQRNLVILELKNTEDRYIVQQLTRYYDALAEEKPLPQQIDYNQPITLMAIAPSFHRDNFTDRKYHQLTVQFIQFSVVSENSAFFLQLKDTNEQVLAILEIPHQSEESTSTPIPYPPRVFLNCLSKWHEEDAAILTKLRPKLLGFDQRMQETIEGSSILYGKGKNYPCAALVKRNQTSAFDARCGYRWEVQEIALWLPLNPYSPKSKLGRVICATYQYRVEPPMSESIKPVLSAFQNDRFHRIEHMPKGARSSRSHWYVWNYITDFLSQTFEEAKREEINHYLYFYRQQQGDATASPDNPDYFGFLVDLALAEWVKRL